MRLTVDVLNEIYCARQYGSGESFLPMAQGRVSSSPQGRVSSPAPQMGSMWPSSKDAFMSWNSLEWLRVIRPPPFTPACHTSVLFLVRLESANVAARKWATEFGKPQFQSLLSHFMAG